MIIVDLMLLAALVFAAYTGAKRGLVLMALELASFATATIIALLAYRPVGGVIKNLAGCSVSLGNVAGFALIWIITELTVAISIRYMVLPRLTRHLHPSHVSQTGGAVLGAVKSLVIITLGLIIFAGLPFSANAKRIVTESYLSKPLLASSGRLQSWLSGGLGRDLGESLNFFTVSSESESNQRVDLGYTTKGTVSAADEDAMLVLINRERTTRGQSALTMNDKARSVARIYSTDMFARGYFSHINPEGKTPFERMRTGGVKFDSAGENLALAPTLALSHQGLMNSPGHRANILNSHYHTVGIGIIDGGPYGLMVTQDFTD